MKVFLPAPWLLLQHLLPLQSAPFYKIGSISAIQVNLIVLSLHYLWLMHLLWEACKATNKVVNHSFSRRTSTKAQDEWSCWTLTRSGSFETCVYLRWMVLKFSSNSCFFMFGINIGTKMVANIKNNVYLCGENIKVYRYDNSKCKRF